MALKFDGTQATILGFLKHKNRWLVQFDKDGRIDEIEHAYLTAKGVKQPVLPH